MTQPFYNKMGWFGGSAPAVASSTGTGIYSFVINPAWDDDDATTLLVRILEDIMTYKN